MQKRKNTKRCNWGRVQHKNRFFSMVGQRHKSVDVQKLIELKMMKYCSVCGHNLAVYPSLFIESTTRSSILHCSQTINIFDR